MNNWHDLCFFFKHNNPKPFTLYTKIDPLP